LFDRDRAAAAVESLTPLGRGQLAALCLNRISGLLDDVRISDEFSSIAELVYQIQEYAVICARQLPSEFDPVGMNRRLRDFLGPDEEPHEELPGWGAWVMDIASVADYVLRTWSTPDESAENCFEVLLSTYSIAGHLEDDSSSPNVPALAEMEFRHQMDEASAIADGGEWGNLAQGSADLAQSYQRWVEYVTG
jgi:hypothetical protein